MTYPTTFSQKLLLCLILRTEVESVLGRLPTSSSPSRFSSAVRSPTVAAEVTWGFSLWGPFTYDVRKKGGSVEVEGV